MKKNLFSVITGFDIEKDIRFLIAKNIGHKIKKLRDNYHLSGRELANIIGISQQQLSRYENGLGDISAYKLILISHYFNLNIEFFLGVED